MALEVMVNRNPRTRAKGSIGQIVATEPSARAKLGMQTMQDDRDPLQSRMVPLNIGVLQCPDK